MSPTRPVLALLFNAFVWGVSWWPLRTLHSAGVHPLWATALVYLVALVMLTEVLFATGPSALLGASQSRLRMLMGGTLIVLATLLALLPTPAARLPLLH